MSSRSLRRSVAILAFSALLAPVTSLHAAQARPAPTTHHHNVVIQYLLGLLAEVGVHIDTGVSSDQNG